MAEFDFIMDPFIVGTLHGNGPSNKRSFVASVNLFPGVAVKIDKDNELKVVAWTNAGDYANLRGIGVVARFSGAVKTYADNPSVDGSYRAGTNVPIIQQETMSLVTSVEVKAGDLAYNEADTGVFTNVALNNGLVIGSFLDSGTAGSIVRIQLNYL
jgi:hypothetical protein